MEKKKLIAPRDGLLLLGLLVLTGILFLVLGNRPQGAAAVVERDGEILCRQELSALAAPMELEFEGEGGHRATLRISPEGGCFLASTCPDQTCVRTGVITHAGETALCLPARLVLRLEGAAGEADAETY